MQKQIKEIERIIEDIKFISSMVKIYGLNRIKPYIMDEYLKKWRVKTLLLIMSINNKWLKIKRKK